MRTTYIHNYARTLAGQLRIKSCEYRYATSPQEIARFLCHEHWSDVALAIVGVSGEVQARLAVCGAGDDMDVKPKNSTSVTLEEVHVGKKGSWLDPSMGGGYLVWAITITSLIAAMADNFWDECERQRAANTDFLTKNGLVRQS